MAKSSMLSVVILGASLASAQFSISSNCQNAITGLSSNAAASACLSPGSFLPLFLSSNTSIIDPVNNWLTSICASNPCSNDTIAAVVANVSSGCSAELNEFGYSSSDVGGLTTLIQQDYPTVRQVLCLKDGSTNCITETLKNVSATVGTLTINNIIGQAMNMQNVSSDIACSNCAKAMYNILNQSLPDLITSSQDELKTECGASFLDGQTPAGISQTAVSTGNSKGNGGLVVLLPKTLIALSAVIITAVVLL